MCRYWVGEKGYGRNWFSLGEMGGGWGRGGSLLVGRGIRLGIWLGVVGGVWGMIWLKGGWSCWGVGGGVGILS